MSAIQNVWADKRSKWALGALVATGLAIAAFIYHSNSSSNGAPAEILAAQQPHRAVYDLSLGRMKSGADVQDISGRMVVEWRGGPSCGGYSSEQRIVTRVTDADGNTTTDDARVTTWESVDEQEFHFDRSEYLNGELHAQASGEARRAEDQKSVILQKDNEQPITLPAETMFPTAFNNELAAAAVEGRTRVSASLFDGTEDKVSAASAFIGKKRAGSPDAENVKIDNVQFGHPIKGEKAWPVRISYFDQVIADSTPSFQMGFLLYKNGVSSELSLEYGDVTMKGELVGVEYFKPGSC